MSDIKFQAVGLEGLYLIQQKVFCDERGRFARLFCQTSLSQQGRQFDVRQINYSRTLVQGSVRGLHYQQAGYAESKLITCTRGAVWDVAVDLRPDSPTFLQWHGQELRADDGQSLLVPAGFAHGFQALTDDSEVLYFTDADYAPDHEAGLSVCDPMLAITWPLPVKNLSSKDACHPWVDAHFRGVRL
ncbi:MULTISPECIES: dTDP-4-dehydrorhamnose 3,5-epimerase [unclassified Pseudomonas]|uniref:dTDP-4-dehydrorhamnose 3,5-epimerase n=1 Tax=unclassified Pseudomonas TaxID=196821 RepID=UPI000837F7F0|nr:MULTISPECIES: dTDP-4-dehydrorhamnose 3,5-epimerase [unclassified Pseudomonas]QIH06927.1 dTDP-4-dehydrorhamnose 3,5-epimerase [Pseudomonas sp. BIOMIG1BAC]